MPDLAAPRLASRAHDTRVVVVGGGVAGLVAAWECAKVGMTVTLLEASDRLGGGIETADLDGLAVDLAADSFPRDAAPLVALLEELGLDALVEAAATDTAWVAFAGASGALRAAPLPASAVTGDGGASPALAGVPANPWADNVRRVIGWSGAWRAYLDRLRPPLTIGREQSLGALVRSRMGARVRDRMVAPLTIGAWGVAPEDVDVDRQVPGLSAALTRTGSLGGAVEQLVRAAAPPAERAAANSANPRATLRGGMSVLVDALAAALVDLGGEVRTGVRPVALVRDGAEWIVRTEGASSADADAEPAPQHADAIGLTRRADGADAFVASSGAASAAMPPAAEACAALPGAAAAGAVPDVDAVAAVPACVEPAVVPACVEPAAALVADVVIIAAEGSSAVALLHTAGVEVAAPRAPVRDIVTLVVGAPALDSGPRGAAVYPAAGAARATGLVHATATWRWLADAAGSGRHVLRISLPSDSADVRGPDALAQDALAQDALAQAELLTGAGPLAVRAVAHRRVALLPPASARGHDERVAAARAAIAAAPGLAVVGDWLSGAGIADVVADAREQAENVRRRVLWGDGEGARPDAGSDPATTAGPALGEAS
ncbi:MAG: FAD-dependent oxidoreductase [Microbacterium sp.]